MMSLLPPPVLEFYVYITMLDFRFHHLSVEREHTHWNALKHCFESKARQCVSGRGGVSEKVTVWRLLATPQCRGAVCAYIVCSRTLTFLHFSLNSKPGPVNKLSESKSAIRGLAYTLAVQLSVPCIWSWQSPEGAGIMLYSRQPIPWCSVSSVCVCVVRGETYFI